MKPRPKRAAAESQLMQKIPAPTSETVVLDLTHKTFATDDQGNLILHEDTGKPIQIARDLITGKWWARVAESLPFRNKDLLQPFIESGAQHINQFEGRGVWIPCAGTARAEGGHQVAYEDIVANPGTRKAKGSASI
jgi:hypothetical protein